MNEKLNNKKLSYREMQELFCDYAFGRLSEDDTMVFDNSINDYPDLIEELKKVRSVFSKVENMDIDKKYSPFTRNLSVKVNQRLENERLSKPFSLIKYLVPAIGSAILLIVLINGNFIFNDTPSSISKVDNSTNKNFTGITTAEAKTIVDSNISKSELLNLSNELPGGLGNDDIDKLAELYPDLMDLSYSTLLDNVLNNMNLPDDPSLSDLRVNSQYNLFDQLENLDEEDIQIILKELENADFNS